MLCEPVRYSGTLVLGMRWFCFFFLFFWRGFFGFGFGRGKGKGNGKREKRDEEDFDYRRTLVVAYLILQKEKTNSGTV